MPRNPHVLRLEDSSCGYASSIFLQQDLDSLLGLLQNLRLRSGDPSWGLIWNLKVYPAVHNFLWRCMRRVLPVLTALLVRRVVVDVACPLCRNHAETLDHLMKDCVCVVPLWQTIMNGHIPDQGDDCIAWLLDILSNGGLPYLGSVAKPDEWNNSCSCYDAFGSGWIYWAY
nr:uncharacterized protein LOC109159890 [Ipomoea batatas]